MVTALFSLSDDRIDNASRDQAPAPVEAVVEPVIATPPTPAAPTPALPVPAPVEDSPAEVPAKESTFPYALVMEEEALEVLRRLKKSDTRRHKRIQTVLRRLEEVGPTYPSLRTKKYVQESIPGQPDTYQSNIENNTPSAWRMFWHWGDAPNTIVVHGIGPHDSNHSSY